MHIASEEHKQLFCRSFIDSHNAYEPHDMPWPVLDETSLARLRAIPVWSMALEAELNAGSMLGGFSQTESDPLVRRALELQGYEESRHGRIISEMVSRYGLVVNRKEPDDVPTRRAFVHFGYDECVDSFAGFGIFKLACEARILPESLTSLFARVLEEEARHIVFFINWIAWDRARRGLRGPIAQVFPAVVSYAAAIVRRIRGGSQMAGSGSGSGTEDAALDLFGDVMNGLTPQKFLRACIRENDRYMRGFDPRLLRPRVIPTLGRIALAIFQIVAVVKSLVTSLRSRMR